MKSTDRQNFVWKLSASFLGGGGLFIFFIILMRCLGPAKYGQVAFSLGWSGLFAMIVDFGFNPVIMRDLPRRPELGPDYFRTIYRMKVLLTVVGLLVLIGISSVVPQARSLLPIVILAYVFLVGSSFVEAGQSFSYVYNKFRQGALLYITHRLLIFVIGGLAILAAGRIVPIMIAMDLASVLGVAVTVIYFHRYFRAGRTLQDLSSLRKSLWMQALPLLMQNIFIIVYFRIDTVLLTWLRGDAETGLYSAAYRFFEITNVVPTAFIASVAAILSRSVSDRSWRAPFRKYTAYCLALGTGACGLLVIISLGLKEFLSASYGPSAAILRTLALALFFLFPNYLFTTMLIYHHRQNWTVRIAAGCVAFNIMLNLYAIPRWGGMGAAWATVGTEAFITLSSLGGILLIHKNES